MDAARLALALEGPGALVAGVLSGTSADGIDAALVRVRASPRGDARPARPELVAFETTPFPGDLGARVRAVLDGAPLDLRGVALLHRDLGRAFGRAARALAERAGVALDLVGSHGQTVWHHDGQEPSGPATLQLGDVDCVAEEARAAAVGDFRMRAIARGSEGAPLCSLTDALLFPAEPRPAAVLNLGGIANVTWLAADGECVTFDVGPANALLDGLARRLLGKPYDEHGAAAARGTRVPELERALLAHPFFDRSPPKSTGRDTFGEAWLDRLAAAHPALFVPARAPDALASAVAALAHSVADALERHVPRPPRALWLCGGGARNRALVEALVRACGSPVTSSAEVGVDPDAREAIAFALLAVERVLGRSALGKLSA